MIFDAGRQAHVMTFEVGAALNDDKWQAPAYCFENGEGEKLQGITGPETFEDMAQIRFL